jgi:hypothetical protein
MSTLDATRCTPARPTTVRASQEKIFVVADHQGRTIENPLNTDALDPADSCGVADFQEW